METAHSRLSAPLRPSALPRRVYIGRLRWELLHVPENRISTREMIETQGYIRSVELLYLWKQEDQFPAVGGSLTRLYGIPFQVDRLKRLDVLELRLDVLQRRDLVVVDLQ